MGKGLCLGGIRLPTSQVRPRLIPRTETDAAPWAAHQRERGQHLPHLRTKGRLRGTLTLFAAPLPFFKGKRYLLSEQVTCICT